MEYHRNYEDIITLLKRYLDGEADKETRMRMEEWLKESKANRELLQRIKSRKVLMEKMRFRHEADIEADWQMICRETKVSSSRLFFRRAYRYVAMVAGVGLIMGLLYTGWKRETGGAETVQVTKQEAISPGFRQASIVLASGERIRLGNREQKIVTEVEGGMFVEKGEGLVVKANNRPSSEVTQNRFNRLEVPKGGEYELVLADGTRVWMNSDSELEFPMAFDGEKRLVRLKGEAYFEVKHDEHLPFEVSMEGMTVLVLGTSFNAFAYNGQVNTTLVKGSVEVQTSDGNYKLIPGEQASLVEGRVKIEDVDIEEQIGWKEGKFIFRSKRLEEVMAVLSRWYNLNVVFQNEYMKNLHFTGNIPRHATVSELLSVLERTRLVHFKIEGRTVLVYEMK